MQQGAWSIPGASAGHGWAGKLKIIVSAGPFATGQIPNQMMQQAGESASER